MLFFPTLLQIQSFLVSSYTRKRHFVYRLFTTIIKEDHPNSPSQLYRWITTIISSPFLQNIIIDIHSMQSGMHTITGLGLQSLITLFFRNRCTYIRNTRLRNIIYSLPNASVIEKLIIVSSRHTGKFEWCFLGSSTTLEIMTF